MWLRSSWEDCRLQWDPAEWGDINTLFPDSEEMWTPDGEVYNLADSSCPTEIPNFRTAS